MIRFILADLRRLWIGSLVIVLLVALATALGVAVTLQERALRLGSARAADKFDLVIGAAGSENAAGALLGLPAAVAAAADGRAMCCRSSQPIRASPGRHRSASAIPSTAIRSSARPRCWSPISRRTWPKGEIFATDGEAVVGAAVDAAARR